MGRFLFLYKGVLVNAVKLRKDYEKSDIEHYISTLGRNIEFPRNAHFYYKMSLRLRSVTAKVTLFVQH